MGNSLEQDSWPAAAIASLRSQWNDREEERTEILMTMLYILLEWAEREGLDREYIEAAHALAL